MSHISHINRLWMGRETAALQCEAATQDWLADKDEGLEPRPRTVKIIESCVAVVDELSVRIEEAETLITAASGNCSDGVHFGDLDPPVCLLDAGALGELIFQHYQDPTGLCTAISESRARLTLRIGFPDLTLTIEVVSEDPNIPAGPWVRWDATGKWLQVR